jgi:ABC-type branched-subunit amino acid transport system substrate-binding protein
LPVLSAPGDIVVGQVGPFSGIPVPDALQLNQGMKAFFAQLNARGGINGRKVDFFELDDTYTPDGFVKAFHAAMERKPAALLSPVGSALLKRMLDDKLLDSADVLVINAIPGAEALRSPGHPRLFHVRAGDKQQIEKMVQYARTLGTTSLAVLYQNLPIGTSGLAVAKAAAEAGAQLKLQAFEATAEVPTLEKAALQIAKAEVQAVLALGAPRFMVDGVAALRKVGFAGQVYALGYVPPGLLAKVAGPGARGVALAQTYPNPMGVASPLQREFQAAMKAAAPDVTTYTSFHLEGYVSARVFSEAARRSKQPGAEALAASLRGMGEVDLGGFRVNFAKGNVGSSFVDIGVMGGQGALMF